MRPLSLILVLLLSALPALAQVTLPRKSDPASPPATNPDAQPTTTPKSNPPTTPIPPSFTGNLPPLAAATPLSDETLNIEAVGLTMSLPAGSLMVQGADGDGTLYQIMDEKRTWTIEVKARQSAKAETTVHDVADLTLNRYKQLSPTVRPGLGTVETKIDSSGTLLQRLTDFTLSGLPTRGERIYYAAPAGNGGRVIMGCTILKPLPTTFVTFELTCDESSFPQARAAYEVAVATARFEDPSKVMAARAAALSAGTEFLGQLTDEKLLQIADGQERMYRWWRPGHSGEAGDGIEVGWRSVKASKGRRSDIGAGGNTGRDNPAGLVVNTQVRLLQLSAGGKPTGIIDSDTKSFISADRKEEGWITTTIVRELKGTGSKPQTFTETGFRNGQSMTIVSKSPDKPDSVVQPVLRTAQYTSVAETQVLGSLLVLDAKEQGITDPREMGFYAYRADAGTVSLRRDTVLRDTAKGNTWTVRTRLRDEKVSSTSLYREDGSLLRAELSDGSVWEPIEPDALLKLWKNKNLPVK